MTEYTQYIVSHIRGQITGDYEKICSICMTAVKV